MSTLLAVDASSVFMRALSVLPEDKRTVDDLEFMTVGMIRKAVRVAKADHLVVALVSGMLPEHLARGRITFAELVAVPGEDLTPTCNARDETEGDTMSHFTVMLKITPERLATHAGDVPAAVAEMLAPYDEGTDDPKYQEFEDEEDEERQKYETGSSELVRCEDGSLASRYDERFRVPGTFGTIFGAGDASHRVPDHLKVEDVPHKERFPTFEVYMKDYCGHDRRDERTGRYGYWRNPKKTWDWYSIGGRWTGMLPVKPSVTPRTGRPGLMTEPPKPGHADVARVADIDMDVVATETRERAEEFWDRWEMYKRGEIPIKNGKPDGWFRYSVRDQALDLGLLTVLRPDESGKLPEAPAGSVLDNSEWIKAEPPRNTWTDALAPIDRDTFLAEYIDSFCPLATYAALDDDGWHAPGKVGWFGCSSETPDEHRAFQREFVRRFIKGSPPDTTLVVVDCHI